jgi:mono/diheme cytochrome c family protein
MIKRKWRLWIFFPIIAAIVIDFALFRSDLFLKNQPVVINGIAAPPIPTLVPEQITLGQTVYTQSCATCHGVNLEGKPKWQVPLANGSLPAPPHDSTGHTWHHSDDILIDIIANGGDPKYNSQMPAFKDQLTSEQVAAVLEFIKSRWGRDEQEYQWWITTVGSQQ